ncbi:MAG: chorismate synthase [Oscillospiraceae bacterium]|nr:chorismate synthase [Oscillospiraceae bacterium]
MLRYFTSGETHGKCLTAIIEGVPAGVRIDINRINDELATRQKGYGRGGRMLIEQDKAEILSGVRGGFTLGSPIALSIENKDWTNWESIMGAETAEAKKTVTCPRPGHADLTGGMKYNHTDLRNVLERASARETAARVAVGAIAEQITAPFGITFSRHVLTIGEISDKADYGDPEFDDIIKNSPVGFYDAECAEKAKTYIDDIKERGESVGGIVEVIVNGVIPGLGSYVHYDRKLDANIAFSVMSVQAIKGVEFGLGFDSGRTHGSAVHDEIFYESGFKRNTNNAGGIEGGMSNGNPIVVKAVMKPIPTLYNPLSTVELSDKSVKKASVERSDVCAVPACSVVVKSAVAFEIAKAFLDKFSGDCMEDVTTYYNAYKDRIEKY